MARTGLRRRRVVAVVAVLALLGIVVAIGVSGSRPPKKKSAHVTRPPVALCPLTGLPAPGGHVPARPALAVKIGNEPEGARPQSGLNEADIVYDTPAEGFIMRYVAVYQCSSASSIGPTRSVRWVDWHILQQFGHPILAFAGGIIPDLDTVASLPWLTPEDLLASAAGAGVRITTRVPPDNLYTSTSALWALDPSNTTPPKPVFQYDTAVPGGSQPASQVGIDFSAGTDVVWKWDASAGLWLHTYSGVPDVDALTNDQVSATNVVIQIVRYSFGPYPESPGGTGDVESVTTGTGPGWVLRNGRSVEVTWSRPTTSSPMTFVNTRGQPVDLAPGRTWVELLPNTTASLPGALTFTG